MGSLPSGFQMLSARREQQQEMEKRREIRVLIPPAPSPQALPSLTWRSHFPVRSLLHTALSNLSATNHSLGLPLQATDNPRLALGLDTTLSLGAAVRPAHTFLPNIFIKHSSDGWGHLFADRLSGTPRVYHQDRVCGRSEEQL